jgi:NitT/TauT family transport system substrate-binding protein
MIRCIPGKTLPRVLALLLCAFVALAGADKPARAADKIILGFVSHGALQWPEYTAQHFGWFKEAGVEVDMVTVGGGAAQQLVAGAIHIGYSGFPDFVRAANQGAPLKIVINGIAAPPYAIYAKPAIKTIKDLKGKIISIGAARDITTIYTDAFLKSAGLTTKDVDFVYAKATPDRFAALVAGGVDAAILFPPFTFRAGQQGFTNLGDVEPFLKGYPFTVYAVNTGWAQKNEKAMLGFVKAYGKAVRWLYDPANKAEAVKILVKFAKSSEPDSAATYDYFTRLSAFSKDGIVAPAVHKTMSEGLVWLGDLPSPPPPLARFFDTSYVEKAWK